jgi:IclR family acetate operon transcriptional repressor
MRNLVDSSNLSSVDRALQLLVILRQGDPVSVKSAAEQLGVAPSTASRLFSTLAARGFATQDVDRRYRPGPEMLPRTYKQVSVDVLRQTLKPILQDLHHTIRDTVQLMILVDSSIRFIDGFESTAALRVGVRIGDQMPAYCSAGGKAMLAELPWPEVQHRHQGMLPLWETAKIETFQELRDVLVRTRIARYGYNRDETERGVTGLGVAIHDQSGRPVAAFTAAIPSARFEYQRLNWYVGKLMEATQAATETLTKTLGARQPGTPELKTI